MRYSQLTWQHFTHAGFTGTLKGDGVVRAGAGSAAQGTCVQFDVRAKRRGFAAPLIIEARFQAFGCPHIIAIADWLAEHATGRAADLRLPEPVGALQQLFGVPMEKLGRLFVVEDAWVGAMQAVLDSQKKP